jgi:hypothetical protein
LETVMKRSDALRLFAALVLAAACAACGGPPLGDPNDRLMTDAELMASFRTTRIVDSLRS